MAGARHTSGRNGQGNSGARMTDITDKEAQHLHRLILFSDAVFAIAITLLAIEIHPPEGWHGDVGSFFHLMANKLIAYAVSFAAIGVLWISHRRTYSRLRKADGVLDVLNFLMLGLVALLPLGTELLWEANSMGALVIYVGLVAGVGIAQGLAWGYAAFVGKLAEPIDLPTRRVHPGCGSRCCPGLFCGLSFVSVLTHTPWGFVAIGAIAAGLSVVGRRLQPNARPQSQRRPGACASSRASIAARPSSPRRATPPAPPPTGPVRRCSTSWSTPPGRRSCTGRG